MSPGRENGLSICCLTDDEPAMVARMLSLYREVADEIVVAVDSRVDPDRLAPLRACADRIVRFEYRDPPELSRPWLVGLCSNPWVLMVDGDEIPSQALLDVLPALTRSDVLEARFVRRWCFPDEDHWLDERPWWPDLQRRLLRRGPHLDFDIGVHGGARGVTPSRNVAAPIYHLALVLKPYADRRRRQREYEALRPGLVAVGGGPMNEIVYTPEHHSTRRPQPVPAADREMIRWVLDAKPVIEPGEPLPVVSAFEIARHLPTDGLLAQGYRAELKVVDLDPRTDPGVNTTLLVQLTNTGAAPIPRRDGSGMQVRLAARVLDPPTGGDGSWTRARLPESLGVDDSCLVEVPVRAPHLAGRYTVEFDLVNERSRWFGARVTTELLVDSRWGRFAR